MDKNYREIFGERLRELRKSRKLSQKKLAGILGLTDNAISLYEKGRHEPLFEHLVNIAKFFNVTIEYLLNITEDAKGQDDYDVVVYIAKDKNISADTLKNLLDFSPETLKALVNEISKYKRRPKNQ